MPSQARKLAEELIVVFIAGAVTSKICKAMRCCVGNPNGENLYVSCIQDRCGFDRALTPQPLA